MFAAKDLTLGQVNAFVKLVGGEEVVRGILDGTKKFVIETVVKILDLAKFFTTRTGLWVSPEFHERILAPALAMGETLSASVGTSFSLPKNMTDAEIQKELGDGKVFENAKAFCTYLAGAIEHQWGGTDGDLLNNGFANVFYVRGRNEKGESEVFSVSVNWHSDDRKWRVDAYRLVAYQWRAGYRAFPCN